METAVTNAILQHQFCLYDPVTACTQEGQRSIFVSDILSDATAIYNKTIEQFNEIKCVSILYTKIFFKILVNRLSEILTKEKVLCNTNYTALKNEYNNARKKSKRINLSDNFINLVMNVNLNRFNRVLINNDMIEEYYVQDGIDQGETGYKIEVEKIIDRSKNEEEKLEIMINATAFMNDTMLIENDKESIDKMIKIWHQFFEINDITANVSKYELD
ncbi:hypothetical protein RhiirC2_791133 [Rhizophagus irregularis]|uniref:Uncharacterized protein n=1 Tax=Rhizophagus irregularis TaxID=588596 RepID=A0A2N1MJU3_9GLOM|nr:hypothetical protein RhiirC2_791133 [Rhizophagus irregularis]